MKILVISLLRLGDIVLSAPALRSLRERFPDAELHILINRQFRQITPLMPYVNRFIEFDREKIQMGLGDASVPMFESYERVSQVIEDLNGQNYDLAVNLTHSRLSGWMMSLIEAKEKQGLVIDGHGRASFGLPWFRYLNQQVDFEGSDVFHYSDVFRFAVGTDEPYLTKHSLHETDAGAEEAARFLDGLNHGPVIAVQALTSDRKKDWGLPRFARMIELLSEREPTASFALLGAPFERERLESFASELKAKGIRAELAILSFEGAFSLLKRSQLLISGDTSVKHLGCVAGTRVLELSIGSSDLYRTGAYTHGSVIVQGKEACAPCPHSKACFRETHACASRVRPEAVAMIAGELLQARTFQLRSIAEEFSADLNLYVVEARDSGYWSAQALNEPFTEQSVSRWIDFTCRKIWLGGTFGTLHDMSATEVVKLARLLKRIFPQTSEIELRHLLSDLERQVGSLSARLNGVKTGICHLHGHFEDPRRMQEFVRILISWREKMKTSSGLRSFRTPLDSLIEDDISPAFVRFRRIVDAVNEIEERAAIHLKVLRALQGTEVERVAGVETI